MVKKRKKFRLNGALSLIAIITIILAWFLIVLYLGPGKIVSSLGVTNSLIITFLLGFIGGISSVGMSAFYLTLITVTVGGGNPFLVALIGTLGLTIGEMLIFYLIVIGREKTPPKLKTRIVSLSKWLKNKPRWLIPIFTIIYIGMTPFPNEILVIILALIKYPHKIVIATLLLGNFIFSLLISLVAKYSYTFFHHM